ncbi:hypothetical protein BD410DRAFT_815051 [Rickenella mellea]|uniref:Mitochondrial K+-H+ exchange-related-domain-containing protein n=1 Tax=Rickenella mellea TaxID=50990 RepID=A0A4Y7Q486_9AGAM|nr:hypothetical protein BD410DRAFT_815051 [Rickenella mellea]
MRIIALPLTSNASISGRFTYYHFQTPPRPKTGENPSLAKRALDKALGAWAAFGKAPEGNWKRRIFVYGERLQSRVEFEELALKSIDPSLGPKAYKLGASDVKLDEKDHPVIPLVHPTAFASLHSPLTHLRQMLEKRIPLHKKGFYTWMIIAPFTAPFAIIPIIPNLPFFFCVWRSWSHWKAYKASGYLESLLDQGAIVPEANVGLDDIYAEFPPSPTGHPLDVAESTKSSGIDLHHPEQSTERERLLFGRDAVPRIVEYFELPPGAMSDMYRALDQTAVRLAKQKS